MTAYNRAWINQLASNVRSYSLITHSPFPDQGDLVFFNGLGHVAVATGNMVDGYAMRGVPLSYQGSGVKVVAERTMEMEAEVLSFWPRYRPTYRDGLIGNEAPNSLHETPMEVTTIEDLAIGMAIMVKGVDELDLSSVKVEIGTPRLW